MNQKIRQALQNWTAQSIQTLIEDGNLPLTTTQIRTALWEELRAPSSSDAPEGGTARITIPCFFAEATIDGQTYITWISGSGYGMGRYSVTWVGTYEQARLLLGLAAEKNDERAA